MRRFGGKELCGWISQTKNKNVICYEYAPQKILEVQVLKDQSDHHLMRFQLGNKVSQCCEVAPRDKTHDLDQEPTSCSRDKWVEETVFFSTPSDAFAIFHVFHFETLEFITNFFNTLKTLLPMGNREHNKSPIELETHDHLTIWGPSQHWVNWREWRQSMV